MFVFRSFINTSKPEILDSKSLRNVSLIKLPKYYYSELLILKYLKNPGTQTPLQIVPKSQFQEGFFDSLKQFLHT